MPFSVGSYDPKTDTIQIRGVAEKTTIIKEKNNLALTAECKKLRPLKSLLSVMNMNDIEEPFRRFVAGFNIDRFGVGRHIIRDDRGWRLYDVQVKLLWVCSIRPSFHPNAYLMVVHTKDDVRSSFCFEGSDGLPLKSMDPVELKGFSDPIINTIEKEGINITHGSISLDGISYSLHIRGWGCDLDIKFSNPSSNNLKRIESSLFSCGEIVANTMNSKKIIDYIAIWEKYVN